MMLARTIVSSAPAFDAGPSPTLLQRLVDEALVRLGVDRLSPARAASRRRPRVATSARRSWMARSRSAPISVRARSMSASASALRLGEHFGRHRRRLPWARSMISRAWARASSSVCSTCACTLARRSSDFRCGAKPASIFSSRSVGRLDDARVHPPPEDEDHEDERDQFREERPVRREQSGVRCDAERPWSRTLTYAPPR